MKCVTLTVWILIVAYSVESRSVHNDNLLGKEAVKEEHMQKRSVVDVNGMTDDVEALEESERDAIVKKRSADDTNNDNEESDTSDEEDKGSDSLGDDDAEESSVVKKSSVDETNNDNDESETSDEEDEDSEDSLGESPVVKNRSMDDTNDDNDESEASDEDDKGSEDSSGNDDERPVVKKRSIPRPGEGEFISSLASKTSDGSSDKEDDEKLFHYIPFDTRQKREDMFIGEEMKSAGREEKGERMKRHDEYHVPVEVGEHGNTDDADVSHALDYPADEGNQHRDDEQLNVPFSDQ